MLNHQVATLKSLANQTKPSWPTCAGLQIECPLRGSLFFAAHVPYRVYSNVCPKDISEEPPKAAPLNSLLHDLMASLVKLGKNKTVIVEL